MPLFAVEWYCFAVDKWIKYKGQIFKTQEAAEKVQHDMTKDYNSKKMTGYHPDNVRIAEVV